MFQEWVEEFEKNKLKEQSEADKMFEELGYKIVTKNENFIVYKGNKKDIDFNKKYKYIEVENGMSSEKITMQELQAINKKVEELDWEKVN